MNSHGEEILVLMEDGKQTISVCELGNIWMTLIRKFDTLGASPYYTKIVKVNKQPAMPLFSI